MLFYINFNTGEIEERESIRPLNIGDYKFNGFEGPYKGLDEALGALEAEYIFTWKISKSRLATARANAKKLRKGKK